MARWHRWALALVIAVGLPEATHGQSANAPIALSARVCTLTEQARSYVRHADGSYLYIEPHFMDEDGSVLVLAGQPAYAWSVDAENRGTLLEDRTFFGAIIRDGSVETIEHPAASGTIEWVRGFRIATDHYFFAFEVQHSSEQEGGGREATQASLYVGDLVAGEWRNVRELPSPAVGTVLALSSASVISPGRASGDVSFAVPHMAPSGEVGALFHRRAGGAWSMTLLSPVLALTIDTRRVGGTGEQLLFNSPEHDSDDVAESVWIQNSDGLSRPTRIANTPARTFIRGLQWAEGGSTTQAGWVVAGQEASGAWVADASPGALVEPKAIDANAVQLFHAARPAAPPVWLTHSVTPEGVQSLAALSVYSSQILRADVPYPFVGPLIAVPHAGNSFSVSGPDAHFDPVAPHVRSLLIDFAFVCP